MSRVASWPLVCLSQCVMSHIASQSKRAERVERAERAERSERVERDLGNEQVNGVMLFHARPLKSNLSQLSKASACKQGICVKLGMSLHNVYLKLNGSLIRVVL